jgi:hypothetical protein
MTDGAEDRRAALVEIVRADHEATSGFIDSVVLTSTAMRSVGVTVVLALLGYAVAHKSFAVALCGFAAVPLFLFLDAYHGWLYAQARKHVRSAETVLRLRYRQLEAGDDEPEAATDLERALASHRVGMYLALSKFKISKLAQTRPRKVYVVLYGALAALAAAATVYGALT